jgi:hypothetical protein
MVIQLSYTDILKGPDHTDLGTMPREKITPFVPIVFESRSLELRASWQLINDLYFNIAYIHKTVSGDPDAVSTFSPEFWWGTSNSLNIGLNFGF